jgi:hypothetical protein
MVQKLVILLIQLRLVGELLDVRVHVQLIMVLRIVDEGEVLDEEDDEVEVDLLMMMIQQLLVEMEFFKDQMMMGLMNSVTLVQYLIGEYVIKLPVLGETLPNHDSMIEILHFQMMEE